MSGARRGRGATPPPAGPGERGQATVELAFLLPVLVLLAALLVQAGMVVRDQILLVHAVREGARALAADDGGGVREAQRAMEVSSSLPIERAGVTVTRSGGLVTVAARYTSPVDLPFLGQVLDGVGLEAEATMRDEGG